jgi:hypothetical protein
MLAVPLGTAAESVRSYSGYSAPCAAGPAGLWRQPRVCVFVVVVFEFLSAFLQLCAEGGCLLS